MSKLLAIIFRCLAKFPLPVLHVVGAMLGICALLISLRLRRAMLRNLQTAGYAKSPTEKLRDLFFAAVHAGCLVLETPRIWLGQDVPVRWKDGRTLATIFQRMRGASPDGRRGLIILSPHLGCWEMVGKTVAQSSNAMGREMTVMYRPPRKSWLEPFVAQSRRQPGMNTVPASPTGVRESLRALKKGQVIGLLPDQVPPLGQGVWLNFFNKPAYTMTLAARLARDTQPQPFVLLVWCRRRLCVGYELDCIEIDLAAEGSLEAAAQSINIQVEKAIALMPAQYLWAYQRYKMPRQQAAPKP